MLATDIIKFLSIDLFELNQDLIEDRYKNAIFALHKDNDGKSRANQHTLQVVVKNFFRILDFKSLFQMIKDVKFIGYDKDVFLRYVENHKEDVIKDYKMIYAATNIMFSITNQFIFDSEETIKYPFSEHIILDNMDSIILPEINKFVQDLKKILSLKLGDDFYKINMDIDHVNKLKRNMRSMNADGSTFMELYYNAILQIEEMGEDNDYLADQIYQLYDENYAERIQEIYQDKIDSMKIYNMDDDDDELKSYIDSNRSRSLNEFKKMYAYFYIGMMEDSDDLDRIYNIFKKEFDELEGLQ